MMNPSPSRDQSGIDYSFRHFEDLLKLQESLLEEFQADNKTLKRLYNVWKENSSDRQIMCAVFAQ